MIFKYFEVLKFMIQHIVRAEVSIAPCLKHEGARIRCLHISAYSYLRDHCHSLNTFHFIGYFNIDPAELFLMIFPYLPLYNFGGFYQWTPQTIKHLIPYVNVFLYHEQPELDECSTLWG